MTKREKIIVSAYTGVLLCDFDDLHRYIEEAVGRPVQTIELGLGGEEILEKVKAYSKEEFLEICEKEE